MLPEPEEGSVPPPPPPELRLPPPPSRASEDAAPRRLHPSVMAIWPLSQVGPLLVLIVIGTVSPWPLLALLVASAASSVVRYERFRWRIAGGALVIEQGLLQRRRRVIPLERIQTVDLVRGVRHRLFGVVEVRVEAVGGGSTEGRLDALGREEAARLRTRLLGGEGRASDTGAATADEAEPPLVHMTPAKLVVAGLTGGRVGVAAALLGFASQLFGDRADELVESAPRLVQGWSGAVLLVVGVLVVAFLLSVAATVVTYWDFRLWREGDELRVRRGLLEQRFDTIPMARVQALRVEENLFRRLLGCAVVKVDVAGRSGSEGGRDTGLLCPLGTRGEAFALLDELTSRRELAHLHLHAMPARARNRRFFRAAVATAAATAGATALFGWWGLPTLLVGVPAAAAAVDAYRSLGWARLPEALVSRNGVLVRTTVHVRVERVQSVALVSSPPQRWRRLRTVELHIARSPGAWGGPQVVDVDAATGRELLVDLARASALHAPAKGM